MKIETKKHLNEFISACERYIQVRDYDRLWLLFYNSKGFFWFDSLPFATNKSINRRAKMASNKLSSLTLRTALTDRVQNVDKFLKPYYNFKKFVEQQDIKE